MDLNKLRGLIPDRILAILPDAFAKYEINNDLRVAHILAQMAHESGNFTIKTEGMFYSTPARIVAVWPTRFNLDGSGGKKNANEYAKNPEKLAEAVYNGRMGNDQPGDGFRFRGGGFLQTTGKEGYQGYAKYLGKSVGETADLLRSDDHIALDGALWEFVINKKLNALADSGPSDDVVTKVTKIVNGGYNGLPDRKMYFHKFYNALTHA
ncbi:MAG: glycoside hydrolase family 19 protein [Clostridia bacterium]|nr:glycoside hydrolase family 19 protein [Clostridia bacterium]